MQFKILTSMALLMLKTSVVHTFCLSHQDISFMLNIKESFMESQMQRISGISDAKNF